MTEKKQPSIAEILAACRKADGSGGAAETPAAAAEAESAVQSSSAPSAAEPPAQARSTPPSDKPASQMSVAEMIAAARSEKTGAAAGKEPAAVAATPAATASKKPSQMSVAEMMAAARAEKAAPPAKAAAAAKAPSPSVEKAAPKAPTSTKAAAAMDTASILAAARKPTQPGPMSKAEAAKLQTSVPKKITAPTMPEKPAYLSTKPAKPKPAAADQESTDRRGFFSVLFGSFLAVGFSCLAIVHVIWGLGLARFMFPNILTEAPSKFKVGFPSDFPSGTVATKFKAQFGVWIVNTEYEGQMQIVALKSVCTHLGCTPNWLDGEQKFKCPCHGSGFYIDGINFEGPAPRPLERYAIRLADDGQLEVDKSKKFQQELGQWNSPMCFVPV